MEDMEKQFKRKINAIAWRFGVTLSLLSNVDSSRSAKYTNLGVNESRKMPGTMSAN